MAAQVDTIILVLDAQSARRETVKRAAQLLQQAHTPIVGAVINKVPTRGKGYYGYGYGYQNSKNGVEKSLPKDLSHRALTAAMNRIKRLKEAVLRR